MSDPRDVLEEQTQTAVEGEYMSAAETAEYLRVSVEFLKRRRRPGADGPPFMRLGGTKIVYRRADVDRWASEWRVDPNDNGGDGGL